MSDEIYICPRCRKAHHRPSSVCSCGCCHSLAPAPGSTSARELYKATGKDRRYVKRLRKLGASNYEIANALGIPEDSPVLQE